jgi:hypothetical protein
LKSEAKVQSAKWKVKTKDLTQRRKGVKKKIVKESCLSPEKALVRNYKPSLGVASGMCEFITTTPYNVELRLNKNV